MSYQEKLAKKPSAEISELLKEEQAKLEALEIGTDEAVEQYIRNSNNVTDRFSPLPDNPNGLSMAFYTPVYRDRTSKDVYVPYFRLKNKEGRKEMHDKKYTEQQGINAGLLEEDMHIKDRFTRDKKVYMPMPIKMVCPLRCMLHFCAAGLHRR